MAEKNILIVCGEASGDMHAGNLALALRKLNPDLRVFGIGGSCLQNAGAEILYDIKDLSVIGLFDVLKKLPAFFRLKSFILETIKTRKPDAVILVDFSGFNLRLAKTLNKSVPVLYFISPQVWASREGRIKTIQKYVDKLIVLFRFEEEFYREKGMQVDWAGGHPLLDIVAAQTPREKFLTHYGLNAKNKVIALLPGSRVAEIKNILPVMLKAAHIIKTTMPEVQFIIAKTPQVDAEVYELYTRKTPLKTVLIENKTYDCMQHSNFCLVASGTATLETAILGTPFLVIYKMNPLNYLLYRPQVKVPFISLVNLLAKESIVPEFIQDAATPESIAQASLDIINSPSLYRKMIDNLARVKTLLGEKGASEKAALIIHNFINSRENKSC